MLLFKSPWFFFVLPS